MDFICKHGDLDMFKTFIGLAKFDLEDNQPILSYKLTPYAGIYLLEASIFHDTFLMYRI